MALGFLSAGFKGLKGLAKSGIIRGKVGKALRGGKWLNKQTAKVADVKITNTGYSITPKKTMSKIKPTPLAAKKVMSGGIPVSGSVSFGGAEQNKKNIGFILAIALGFALLFKPVTALFQTKKRKR